MIANTDFLSVRPKTFRADSQSLAIRLQRLWKDSGREVQQARNQVAVRNPQVEECCSIV